MSDQNQKPLNVLIVDDEPYNVRILDRLLKRANYNTATAEDGVMALEYLEKNANNVDIILLDRMMPRMNGMEVLARIKQHKVLSEIPVIMQTAAASPNEVVEGIKAGAYYYITKPFEEEVLLSIVNSAAEDWRSKKSLHRAIEENKTALGLISLAQFKLQSLQEAYNLSYFLANYFPNPKNAVYGIYALIINALEFGNLGMTQALKQQLLKSGQWQQELLKRQAMVENKYKFVEVRYGRDEEEIKLYIRDEGQGFNWKPYLELDPTRLVQSHGRGIALAKKHSFDNIEYLGSGNEVLCTVKL